MHPPGGSRPEREVQRVAQRRDRSQKARLKMWTAPPDEEAAFALLIQSPNFEFEQGPARRTLLELPRKQVIIGRKPEA
jgi:hypothetical protein